MALEKYLKILLLIFTVAFCLSAGAFDFGGFADENGDVTDGPGVSSADTPSGTDENGLASGYGGQADNQGVSESLGQAGYGDDGVGGLGGADGYGEADSLGAFGGPGPNIGSGYSPVTGVIDVSPVAPASNPDPRGETVTNTPSSRVNNFSPGYENTVSTDELRAHIEARSQATVTSVNSNPVSSSDTLQIERTTYYGAVEQYYSDTQTLSEEDQPLSKGPMEAARRSAGLSQKAVDPTHLGIEKQVDQAVRQGARAYMPGDEVHRALIDPLQELPEHLQGFVHVALDTVTVVAPPEMLTDIFGVSDRTKAFAKDLDPNIATGLAVIGVHHSQHSNEPFIGPNEQSDYLEEVAHVALTFAIDDESHWAGPNKDVIAISQALSSAKAAVRGQKDAYGRYATVDKAVPGLPTGYVDQPGLYGRDYANLTVEVQAKALADEIGKIAYGHTDSRLGRSIKDGYPNLSEEEVDRVVDALTSSKSLAEQRQVTLDAISELVEIGEQFQ